MPIKLTSQQRKVVETFANRYGTIYNSKLIIEFLFLKVKNSQKKYKYMALKSFHN